ncbi:MAG: flagellar biosynthesis protein FlhB [Syntrophomonadaceae bacterium]|nr:flagellar biosynthesis protein FlhB [Syntrophomonadaceae bacterium]
MVKDKKAVALKYDEKDNAPRVVARGFGFVAERIEEIAAEAGVYVKQDAELVEYLSVLDIDQEIPPDLYAVVAEILVFVYHLDSRKRKS